jgi:hypothetical protein
MTAATNLIGQRFGKLEAIAREGSRGGRALWLLRCDCGRDHRATASNLKCGNVKHCGCASRRLKHGMAGTQLYKRWDSMIQRCTNPNASYFHRYGGRGITVCSEWLDFASFSKWALANGYNADLQLDRIDNDAGYQPDNCRFVTPKLNSLNKANTRLIKCRGKMVTIQSAVQTTGISEGAIRTRLARGWTDEEATSWRARRCVRQ